ncbi:MAG: hypothetical protein K2K80_00650 [Clostridia bacterium]|nr:hypothetical protein [Clostridia bacterium]
MKILYGTTNQAKLNIMKPVAEALNFELIGLNNLNKPLPNVDESGKDPLENAKIKARTYYEAFGLPVFSCDSGLYFDGLEERLQPMTHVRRINGRDLSDDEMTEYYAELSKTHGGKLIGRYRNAICFIADEHTEFSSMDDSLSSKPFILSSVPHPKKVKGFPLDRLSIDIKSGKYYYDMEASAVKNLAVEQGLTAFFKNALSEIHSKR